MKKPTSDRNRNGMAIPVVMTFILVLSVFLFSILKMRTETKQSNIVTFHYLKAHLMAQSAIQHVMIKIRLFPDEAFEAAARQFGICPMNDNPNLTAGTGNGDLMNHFTSDVVSTEADLGVPGIAGWGYKISKVETKAAFRKNNKLVTVVEIFAEGWATEEAGGLKKRTEIVRKTVSIVKSS